MTVDATLLRQRLARGNVRGMDWGGKQGQGSEQSAGSIVVFIA